MMTKKQKEVGDGDSEGSSKSLPSLPFDIIVYDILTRIPINCLMPFRRVCKSWSTLILNDFDFIKLHSTRTCPSLGFIDLFAYYPDPDSDDDNSDDEDAHRERVLEETEAFQDWQSGVKKSKGISFYDVDKKKSKLFYFRQGLFNKKLRIRGSFNGLVLLSCEEGYREYSHHVYNPTTCNSIKLPVLNGFLQQNINELPHFHLVFDPVMEKHKVICITWIYVELQNYTKVYAAEYFFKIVTLGTGTGSDSWRNIDIPKISVSIGAEGYKPVSSNGCLNLLSRSDRKVLHIDVSKESYYTIEYPEGASKTSKLLEIEGSLCILDYTNNTNLLNHLDLESKGKFTLWVLMEDEENKKWIKKYDVDMFHDTSVARPYKRAPVFVATITNPTLKVIFCVSTSRYGDDYCKSDDDEDRYYSYDVELRRLESISRPDPLNYCQWHFNRLIHI